MVFRSSSNAPVNNRNFIILLLARTTDESSGTVKGASRAEAPHEYLREAGFASISVSVANLTRDPPTRTSDLSRFQGLVKSVTT
jgi:hypothetical protein